MDQIKYEKILTDLLGLSIVEKENNDYFEILDEDNNLVGYIKKIRVFNKDKATPIAFKFHTEIKTETVNFINSRLNDTNDNKTDIFIYNIDIIEKNQAISKVIKVKLGKKPSLLIIDQNDDTMRFQVEYDKLYFNCQKQLMNKKYENVVVEIKNYNDGVEYNYSSTITDQRKQLQNQGDKKSYRLFIKQNPIFRYELTVKEQKKESGKIIKSIDFNEKGLDEKQIINRDVIETFDSFKFLIEDFLPFDIYGIKSILENTEYKYLSIPFILEQPFTFNENVKVKTFK